MVVGLVASIPLWLAVPAAAAPADTTPAPPASVQEPAGTPTQAEVDRLELLIGTTEDTLEQATVDAEATADTLRVAQTELAAAETQAATSAATLAAAQAATATAEADIADVAREAFMSSGDLGSATLLLDAEGPTELIQRATTLDVLGQDRAQRLNEATSAQEVLQQADESARAAVLARDQALATAAQAEAAAAAQLAQAQSAYDAAAAQREALDQQLQAARVAVLTEQGVENPEATNAAQQQTAETQATSGTGQLVTGRVTSCYGNRGGTLHAGIDIAAPIGTPIYAPEDGVVINAGAASGYGLAVYIQHPDGTITLYGHINAYFVTAGQAVSAGDVIAEVGNRGQSTGPHLHIETHTGGLYANRINPAPWLAARGITFGDRCS